jgi:hypothetical protein
MFSVSEDFVSLAGFPRQFPSYLVSVHSLTSAHTPLPRKDALVRRSQSSPTKCKVILHIVMLRYITFLRLFECNASCRFVNYYLLAWYM